MARIKANENDRDRTLSEDELRALWLQRPIQGVWQIRKVPAFARGSAPARHRERTPAGLNLSGQDRPTPAGQEHGHEALPIAAKVSSQRHG
jgi:hypothetical protein